MSKKFRLISALMMSSIMSFIISFVMTVVNVGMNAEVVGAWLRSWGLGLLVAFPLAYLLPPVIQGFLKGRGLE